MKTQQRVAIALLSAALAVGCGGEEKAAESGGKPVVTTAVKLADLEEHIEASGELHAKDEAAIAAEVPGQVTQLAFDEGQAVTAGQVVLEIDPQKRELEVQSARAGLAEATAALRDAEREYRRMKVLRERDVAAESKMDQVETQVALARSREAAAQAQLGVAERALRDASVRAPFSGFVGRRHVSRGEYVQVGQPLFELVALDPVEAEFHLAERDSARVESGQEVILTVEPHPGETFRGRVTLISPTIDPKTRTLRVEADVANPDARLRPGLFARVDLGVALRKGVLMVPEEAVLQRADGEVVFRAGEGNRVKRVVVTTGSHRDGMVEVASGLAPGDVVVARGQAGLIDGVLVSPRNPDGTIVRTDVSAADESIEGRGPMNLIDIFIDRPILTWMLTLSMLVFGWLGYERLGVDQFPKMEFPVVRVSATMEGANPEVMEEDVTDVLEEQINTIAGVRKLSSKSGQGGSTMSVEFELDQDIDTAAQDVRDRIARARQLLPDEVENPVVDKINLSNFPIMWIPLNGDRPPVDMSEFVRRTVKPKLETAEGVAGIQIFGRLDREIRIWIDGEALRSRGLAVTDVVEALRREHVEIPGGLVESREIEYSVKTDAEYRTLDELRRMVVAWSEGAPVLLSDVARVEDGHEDQRLIARYDGTPAVGFGVMKQSDANTVAVADEIHRRIDQMQETLPAGLSFKRGEGVADFSRSIREAISETIFSLQFGAILATLTVFAFLRRWRPTMIVGLAIPVSLVTTFGFMWTLGYTLNTMTLLAMTLSVGVVVDDAIVVLENIERHRDLGLSSREAASKGTRQIAFAATAATLSIAAVFVPVVFVEGIVGNFLGEFGATVAISVLISLVTALTLTPMLAARVPAAKERAHGSIYHWLEVGFVWIETHYSRLLDWTLGHRWTTLAIAAVSFVVSLGFASQLGAEFFPPSDESRFFVEFETPPGTSVQGTLEILKKNEEWILAQPEVAGLFAGAGTGRQGSGPPQPTEGVMFAMLKEPGRRERSAQEIVVEARRALGQIPGQRVLVSDMSGMMFSGGRGQFEIELRGNVDLDTLDRLAIRMIEGLTQAGGFVDLDKTLKLGRPELRVTPDREKAAALGIDARTLASTIQAMIGGMDVADYKEAGRRYDIRVRLDEKDRNEPAAIERLYARARDGGVVELRNLVTVEKTAAPSEISRVDRQRSVSIYGNLEGLPLGEAIQVARRLGDEVLPEGVTLHLSGAAESFSEGMASFGVALALSILVIYMILAAQFESLTHPLTVMMALPLAMVGAMGGLYLLHLGGKPGMTINLFSIIGIILLMGLVTKNSILLVDYANELRRDGLGKVEAMRKAAPIRLRPVLMTAISMVLGVVPAAFGLGPGSETRAPMAVAAGAGMFSSTFLTLLVVPIFYLMLDDASDWVKAHVRRRPEGAAEPTPQPSGAA